VQVARDSPDADLVVSVCEPSHNPYYSLVEPQRDGTLRVSKAAGAVRRQDVPVVWGLNGSIYVWRRAAIARAVAEGFWSLRIKPSVMPRERSVDIDDALDFEFAQWLHARRESGR
jgi:N-acylneuraminate cytidylyltransferase